MNRINLLGSSACLAATFWAAPLTAAYGEEKKSPMMPGGSAGNAAAALPAEGLYFNNEITFEQGKVVDGNGRVAKTPAGATIKTSQIDETPSLLWVPGVDILGARYATGIAQPYARYNVDFGGASTGGAATSGQGFFNTILIPAILSWDVGSGFFIGSGVAVAVKNGHFTHHYDAQAGRETLANDSYANNFWTLEPNLAVSYLNNGWNLSLNNTIDFNTKNDVTNYKSGSIYYLDVTSTKKIDKFTFGIIGNFLKQWEPDKINDITVGAVNGFSSAGNKSEVIAVGPLLSYDFGQVSLRLRYLHPIRSENQGNISFIRLDLPASLY